MKRVGLRLLLIGVLCIMARYASASHVVGGELMYEHKNLDTYVVRLVLFIDCQNGLPGAIADDRYACIGIFSGRDSSFLDSFFMERTPPERINLVSYSCIFPPDGACVDKYEYETTIQLPDSNDGFILTYQRCCRNRTITNLTDPAQVGSTLFTRILPDSVLMDNSSPVFKNLPPNFVCVGMDLYFDHSAKDLDGDSLVYDFYTPYEFPGGFFNPRPWPPSNPPYPEVPWQFPYNLSNPLGAKSILTINKKTGLLHMKPAIIGQFVVGIIVHEYRNGVHIGETRRDYQFNVMPCQLNVNAYFETDSVYCDKTVQFDNKHVGKKFRWDFGVPGTDSDTSSEIAPMYTYPANGTYLAKLVAEDGNCMDTVIKKITILDRVGHRFARKDTAICEPALLQLSLGEKPGSLFSYSWTPAENLDFPNIPNPTAFVNQTTTFVVKKVYKNCTYEDSFTVRVLSPKGNQIAGPDTSICYGQKIYIGDKDDTSSLFTYVWNPPTWLDRADVPNPLSNAAGDITYTVIKSYDNCTFYDTVRIKVFHAKADFKPDSIYCSNPVSFTSNSVGSSFYWDFGIKNSSTDTSTLKSPEFTFPAVGKYLVTHVAIDGKCTDTIKQLVKVLKTPKGAFSIEDTAICYGDKIRIGKEDTTSGFTYTWTPSTWLDNPGIANPTSTPQEDITYVVLKSFEACTSSDTVRVHVRNPKIGFNYEVVHNCADNVITFENTSKDADRHLWYINDTLASTAYSPIFNFPYGMQVRGYLLISDHGACALRKEFDINLPAFEKMGIFIPNVITPNNDAANDCFKVVGFKNLDMICIPESLEIYNRWGERVHSNPESCWDGRDERTGNKLTAGVYYYVLRFEGEVYKGTVTLLR